MDNKAHTLIKYDCKVGDSYTLTKSTGRVLTRTVTARSDKDDFPFGLWMIKTITAEQNLGVYGVRKFIYRANHRFGIVHVIAIMDDGDTAKTYLYSDSTRAYANMENK